MALPVCARQPRPRWREMGRTEGRRLGLAHFRKIFSPGDGFIYAVNGAGELFWYYHKGFKDGSNAWQGPVRISSDWGAIA
jgi:hypothetical protein